MICNNRYSKHAITRHKPKVCTGITEHLPLSVTYRLFARSYTSLVYRYQRGAENQKVKHTTYKTLRSLGGRPASTHSRSNSTI